MRSSFMIEKKGKGALEQLQGGGEIKRSPENTRTEG